jgi:hypothetical protein
LSDMCLLLRWVERRRRGARTIGSDETPQHYSASSAAITARSTRMPSTRRRSRLRRARCDGIRILDPPLVRCRLDRLHQLGHLRCERVSGQHCAGFDDQKQKPVILNLAARDRCAREEVPRPGSRKRARSLRVQKRRRRHPWPRRVRRWWGCGGQDLTPTPGMNRVTLRWTPKTRQLVKVEPCP